MRTALVLLAIVAMASARGVNFVNNAPPQSEQNGQEVHVVDNNPNPDGSVHVVDNNPNPDGNGVQVVDLPQVGQGGAQSGCSPNVQIVDNVDPLFGQPIRPPNGGFQPIDIGPAFVDNYPNKFNDPLLRGG